MSSRDDLLEAQSAMLAVLDEKLKDMPEWRAFRAMEKFITAIGNSVESGESPASPQHPEREKLSYGDLGHLVLSEAGKPLATPEMLAAVARRRGVDPEEKKAVISTALSKDERIENIRWGNGRAWWLVGRALPTETAHANH
jgi:hypothetical protein